MSNQKKKNRTIKITLEDLFEVTQSSFGKLEKEMVGLKGEVIGMKQEIDKRFDEVISMQDKLLKDVEDLKDEKVMDIAFRDRFNKLERRVEEIELKMRHK